MAIFGAPMPLPLAGGGAPLAAVRAALDMQEMVSLFNAERQAAWPPRRWARWCSRASNCRWTCSRWAEAGPVAGV